MKIKEEFRALIPKLSDDEFRQLEENCLSEGIRDSIITWNDFIIDGHNRYEIAKKHNLDFVIEEKQFDDETKAKEWMILNQFGRRNLSSYQRGLLALELKSLFQQKAKKNLSLGGGDQKSGLANLPKAIEPINTRKEVAKVANIGERTIDKIEKIRDKATEEIKEKVSSGEISINQAFNEIKKDERKEKIQLQIETINKGIDRPKGLYNVIVIDPPWNYGRDYDPNGSRVSNPYPEMTQKQLLDFELPSADNCVLWLWTTHAFIWDAKELMDNWGFTYKAILVWDKEKMGMGSWLRMQAEFCLMGIKGSIVLKNQFTRDVIREPRTNHSKKPESFYVMVDNLCPGNKIEIFSRSNRLNWDTYGDEVE